MTKGHAFGSADPSARDCDGDRARRALLHVPVFAYSRYMNAPEPSKASAGTTLLDPETDPSASWALDQGLVRRLTGLLRATSGESVRAISPINGQPLGDVPQSSTADVEAAFERARRAQRVWAETSIDERAAIFLRLHDLVLERQDEI